MSKLEELIQKYCPEGVEYKRIEEVCRTKTPPLKLQTSDYQEEGAFPIIDQGQKQITGYTDREDALLEDKEYILYGDHTCIVKYHKGIFAQGADGLKILLSDYNNTKYVYYALCAYNLRSTEYKRHWTQAKEIEIPVPPLPVQEEIVRILDTFTELQAELQAELQKRKQQYNYYRDNLLSFEGRTDVEWKKLGDLARTYKGAYITQKASKEGSIPVVLGGQEPAYYIDTANHSGELVAISRSGASAGFVSYWNEPIYITDGFGFEADTSILSYKYLYYSLKRMESSLQQMKRGGGVPHVSHKELILVELPIPSLAEQQKIVDILDRFDTLTGDLAAGLPAEIEKRRQQYEYYRDKLLSFKRYGSAQK